ncbi:MAG: fatty acid hydroxylase family protein [Deltaproteobacteria bacterium]|nr:MAG: fatty acid hydroxylase family protein [Deltaproteobacteria bacterium]
MSTAVDPHTVSPAPAAARPASRGASLAEVARTFFRYPTPWIIGGGALMAWGFRLFAGPAGGWDLLIVAAILALWPVQEWLIHVTILHFRPKRIGRFTLDLHNAKKHRLHHREPERIELVFVPLRTVLTLLPVHLVAWHLIMPTAALAWTTIAVYFTLAFTYEWTHYLVHTRYRPRSRFYRRLWENHRLHHYRNGRHWYGVSMLMGDRLLGTAGDSREVPLSPSAKDILHDEPAGAKP